VPVLVDGNNLLFAARDIRRLRKTDQGQLCRLLGQYARRKGTSVTVVFDGPAPRLAAVQLLEQAGVAVRFSSGRTADDVLVEVLEGARAPGEYLVVTSDHAIQHAARYRRATAVDADKFLRAMLEPPQESESSGKPASPEKPDDLTPDEADAWLRQFGEDPDAPPDETELMR
jgi:predicted RNA-binding protein with PIN domain